MVKDQAETLRRRQIQWRQSQMNWPTRVISFTSGKGGVGKTHTVVNMGIALARERRNVLILDADLGLANIDVMLGIPVKHTLHDELQGQDDRR